MAKETLELVTATRASGRQAPMDADVELRWRLYEDHQKMARHHDSQRATFTQYILILAAAATGVAKLGEFVEVVNAVLGFFVVGAGLVGFWTTWRLCEACREEKKCGNDHLSELRQIVPSLKPDSPHPDSGRWPWQTLHGLVVILGIAILVCTFLHGDPAQASGAVEEAAQAARAASTS